MLDLGDELTAVLIDDVPRKGAAQLCRAQRVDGTTRIFLRSDIRLPSTVASDEGPHCNSHKSCEGLKLLPYSSSLLVRESWFACMLSFQSCCVSCDLDRRTAIGLSSQCCY